MTPFSFCLNIAKKNGSPLFLVSRLLGEPKRRLFITTYAAMRIVDDLVDETFFANPQHNIEHQRTEILKQIQIWRQQALAASQGIFQPQFDSFYPMVFTCLNTTIGISNLGPWPWNALTAAMEHDVMEKEIISWNDFLNYCEGATVAPAATFAYILACELRDGRYVLEQYPEYCQDHVRDMAIFCYLIHIIRDLAKDVKKHTQLITIPYTLLNQAGLQRESLRHHHDHKASIECLIRALLTEAEKLLISGAPTIAKITLPKLETMILQRLLNKYIQLFHQLSANPTRFLS